MAKSGSKRIQFVIFTALLNAAAAAGISNVEEKGKNAQSMPGVAPARESFLFSSSFMASYTKRRQLFNSIPGNNQINTTSNRSSNLSKLERMPSCRVERGKNERIQHAKGSAAIHAHKNQWNKIHQLDLSQQITQHLICLHGTCNQGMERCMESHLVFSAHIPWNHYETAYSAFVV